MFLQHSKAKLYGKIFISIILFYDGIFVLANVCQNMSIHGQLICRWYLPTFLLIFLLICNMLCFRHSAYVVKADVIAFDYMADVIAIFSYVILLHIGQMLGPYLLLYNTG